MTVFEFPGNLADLVMYDPESLAVSARESKRREFKQSFVQNDFSDYTKTLAAFANARSQCFAQRIWRNSEAYSANSLAR